MAVETTNINIRMEKDLKEKADKPNAETIAAMREIEDMRNGKVPRNQMSVSDFLKEMEE